MLLPLEDVRSLAVSHNYQEIQHNPTSRVIIFRSNGNNGGGSGSMQVNVYYTTGTVGTCLNHPKQGKTQLFRRGVVTLDMLSEIFQNPRIHTGVGYKFRKNINIWQPSTASTGNNQQQEEEPEAECDLVRRWRYVCAAMDLSSSLSSQRTHENANNDGDGDEARILRFCKLWNALEFPASADFSRVINRRTGASCVLFSLLFVAAQKYHRVGCVYMNFENDEYNREPTLFDINELIDCQCTNGLQFASEYSSELMEASAVLGDFNSSKTREELLLWFFSRMSPGNFLVRILLAEEDQYNNAVAAAADPQPEFMSGREDMDMIHREYSKLYYPKKSKLCPCHGYIMERSER
jgi:hypothetical protein